MEFLSEYGIFLAKTLTIIIGLVAILLIVGTAGVRIRKMEKDGHIEINNLNQKFTDISHSLKSVILHADEFKSESKLLKKAEKQKALDEKTTYRPKLYVLEFHGDLRASAGPALTEEVSAVLGVAKKEDEVLVKIESSGGMVHSYGLAASQLARIRERGIPLTVAIDKVAASGGYMMACLGEKIISAPFAMIGSIGVVAQLPNFHRLLKKNDIDVEILTAGEFKRTLTIFGENTDKGRQKFIEELDQTHDLFKSFVKKYRPNLDIDKVSTGEVWFGQQAHDLGLVDIVKTSDDYLYDNYEHKDIYSIKWIEKKTLGEKIGLSVEGSIDRILYRHLSKWLDMRLWR